MVEHRRVRHLRCRNDQFRKRGRSLTEKQNPLHYSLSRGGHSSSNPSEFESGGYLGGFSEGRRCDNSCQRQERELGARPVLAQPEHDVERRDHVMGRGHSSWPSIQQFDNIHRGRGLGSFLPWPRWPVSRGRDRKFISLEGLVGSIMHSAWLLRSLKLDIHSQTWACVFVRGKVGTIV